MQSVPITTKVVSSNPTQDGVYSIQITTTPHFVVDEMKTKWTLHQYYTSIKKILPWYLNILTKETSKQKRPNKAILSNKSFRFNTGSFIL
jgi:hypothetical protein